jgi:hypothetical protein
MTSGSETNGIVSGGCLKKKLSIVISITQKITAQPYSACDGNREDGNEVASHGRIFSIHSDFASD